MVAKQAGIRIVFGNFASRTVKKGHLAILAVWACILLASTALADDKCDSYYSALAVAKTAGKGVYLGGKHLAKANFIPAVTVFHAIDHIQQRLRGKNDVPILKAIVQNVWKNRAHWLGYLAMMGLQKTTGITHSQFEAETEDYLELTEEDVVVVVDAFSEADAAYSGAGTYVYNAHYKNHPSKAKVFLIKPANATELIEQLWEISRKHRISRLDYFGHGLPGVLITKNHAGDGTNEVWNALMKAERGIKDFDAASIMSDKAMIRFNTCFATNGTTEEGQEASVGPMLGRVLFGKKEHGGVIYGSKVQILPNWVEMVAIKGGLPEPPKWLRTIGDYTSVANGLITFAGAVNLRLSDEENVMEGIFHFNRVSKKWIPNDSYLYDNIMNPIGKELWSKPPKEFPEFNWKGEMISEFLDKKDTEFATRIYDPKPLPPKDKWHPSIRKSSVYSNLRGVHISTSAVNWKPLTDYLKKFPNLRIDSQVRSEGVIYATITNTDIKLPETVRQEIGTRGTELLQGALRLYPFYAEKLLAKERARRDQGEMTADEYQMRAAVISDFQKSQLAIIRRNVETQLNILKN